MTQKPQKVFNTADVFVNIDAFVKDPTPERELLVRQGRRNTARVLMMQQPGALGPLLASPFPDLFFALVESGIRDMPPDEADQRMLADAVTRAMAAPGNIEEQVRWALVELLFVPGFLAKLSPNADTLPAWAMPTYIPFTISRPQFFAVAGHSDAYARHVERMMTVALEYAKRTRDAEFCKSFSERTNFLQLYFNDRNLRPIYEARGKILGMYFHQMKAHSLYAFLPRKRGTTRVGFLAAHWTPQTETYFSLALIEQLDRSGIELVLYARAATGHPLEKYAISRADRFIPVGEHPLKMADIIRQDDLDVLFIGTNMTVTTHLATFAGGMRLARLQVVTPSSPVTSGGAHADVFLSGEWNDSLPDAREQYTELLHRLSQSITVYAYHHDQEKASTNPKRADYGLSNDQVVFFSGANYFKVLPELSRVWVRVLAAVPNSALILMPFNPNWSRTYLVQPFLDRLTKEMQDAGIDPRRLIIIRPVPTRADVHAILSLADVYLDPFPFAGACSMLDPLKVGVAPVTKTNHMFRGSVGAAMLRMVGLEQLVAQNDDEYVKLAVDLANSPDKRARIREKLHESQANPAYMDSAVMSQRVGGAIAEWSLAQAKRWKALEAYDSVKLRQVAQSIADRVIPTSFEAEALTDVGLVHSIIRPLFRQNRLTYGEPHVLDVGACVGEMSIPLVQDGFRATMFEPDPASRQVLQRNVAAFASRVTIEKMAVASKDSESISFHKSTVIGLSGLGKSPYADTEQVISVSATRLDSYCKSNGISRVDVLKIDAEGHDFDALYSFDYAAMQPRVIMVEYNAKFATHGAAAVAEAIREMRDVGYRAVVVRYRPIEGFGRRSWEHEVVEVVFDRPFVLSSPDDFGNILFYRFEDRAFLLAFISVLDSCRPRRECFDPIDPAA